MTIVSQLSSDRGSRIVAARLEQADAHLLDDVVDIARTPGAPARLAYDDRPACCNQPVEAARRAVAGGDELRRQRTDVEFGLALLTVVSAFSCSSFRPRLFSRPLLRPTLPSGVVTWP